MWVRRLPVHIGPSGSYEFAADFRKNGAICRVDVGIDPYKQVEKCIRIRSGFPKKHCIQRADRVVRPYEAALYRL